MASLSGLRKRVASASFHTVDRGVGKLASSWAWRAVPEASGQPCLLGLG